jgi:hypothetical protein
MDREAGSAIIALMTQFAEGTFLQSSTEEGGHSQDTRKWAQQNVAGEKRTPASGSPGSRKSQPAKKSKAPKKG